MPHVAAVHFRVGRAGEGATVDVSPAAALAHQAAVAGGLELHVRQLSKADAEVEAAKTAATDTVGVTPAPLDTSRQLIRVSLEHRRGTFRQIITHNEPGPASPLACAEKLLREFDKAELLKWVTANA